MYVVSWLQARIYIETRMIVTKEFEPLIQRRGDSLTLLSLLACIFIGQCLDAVAWCCQRSNYTKYIIISINLCMYFVDDHQEADTNT